MLRDLKDTDDTGAPDALAAEAPVAVSAIRVGTSQARVRVIRSDALFAGGVEVHIAHGEATYRLRQTALGKLILIK